MYALDKVKKERTFENLCLAVGARVGRHSAQALPAGGRFPPVLESIQGYKHEHTSVEGYKHERTRDDSAWPKP